MGVKRQDRVSILAMNCAEYLEVMHARYIAGFIAATVNFRLAVPEFKFILGDSAPTVLFFEAQYADMVAAMRAEYLEYSPLVYYPIEFPAGRNFVRNLMGTNLCC